MLKKSEAEDITAPALAMLKAMQGAGFKDMPDFGSKWFETMNELGTEMLKFIAERMKQDTQTQHDLLQAKGFAEIQHIQAQFVQKAIDDYSAEMAKLMELGKNLTPTPKEPKE